MARTKSRAQFGYVAAATIALFSVSDERVAHAEITPLADIPLLPEGANGLGRFPAPDFLERVKCRKDLLAILGPPAAGARKEPCFEWIISPSAEATFVDRRNRARFHGIAFPGDDGRDAEKARFVSLIRTAGDHFEWIDLLADDSELKDVHIMRHVSIGPKLLGETKGVRVYGFRQTPPAQGSRESSDPERQDAFKLRLVVAATPLVPQMPARVTYENPFASCTRTGCMPIQSDAIGEPYDQRARLATTEVLPRRAGGTAKMEECLPDEKGECQTPFTVFASVAKSPKDDQFFVSVRISIRSKDESSERSASH